MKKSILLLGALALSASAAFAQIESPYLKITPKAGSELTELTNDVKVVISDEVGTVTNAVIQTVGGEGFGQYAPDPVIVKVDDEAGTRVVNYQLTPELWSTPFNMEYSIQFIVVLSDEEGTPIEGPDGEYVMSMINYTSEDKGNAAMVAYFPNNSMFNEDYSFADAYEAGAMYVYFSKTVTAPENVALVTYYDGEDEINSFEATVISQEWSDMDGLYQVLFSFASPDFAADEIGKIEIQLNPVVWRNPATGEDEVITSSLIVLNNTVAAPQAAPRKLKKGVANGLAVGTESVNVYNLQGMLVVKNASNEDVKNLAPGMYIINGKKVAVK